MSPLGLLNFLVLQWFGFRLARVYQRACGGTSHDQRIHLLIPIGWSTVRWVWPLTGWWSPYRWITRRS